MARYPVSYQEFSEFRRLLRQLEAAAGQSGGIGIPITEATAVIRNLTQRVAVIPESLTPTADWNNEHDLNRPVAELLEALDELPVEIDIRLKRRILTQFQYAGIRTVADLVGRTAEDIDDPPARFGPWLITLIQAALALRNLRLAEPPNPSGTGA